MRESAHSNHSGAVHPFVALFENGLPEFDIGVMSHGFAIHGRDYVFVIENGFAQNSGTYQLVLTHVVELDYSTAVSATGWIKSWSDDFIDYARWKAAGEPDGYIFGSNWSNAYPGFTILEDHPAAVAWSTKLERPMYAVLVETDRFKMSLVFHDAHLAKLSDDAPTVGRTIHPLS